MPHRALSLALAVAGLAVVVALLLARRDVYAAALRGPRWRRRLLAAGIALLGLLGLPSLGHRAEALPVPSGGQEEGGREWSRLVQIWSEAEAASSGARGPYPFDEKGKKRLLERLAAAGADVEAVGVAWKLSPAEVGLLKKGLARLTEGVQEKRPTEMKMATCYEPMPVDWERQKSQRRLAERLPLLEKIAATRRLRPEVIRRAIAHVKQDLSVIEAGGPGNPQHRRDAERIGKAVRAKLAAIEAKLAK